MISNTYLQVPQFSITISATSESVFIEVDQHQLLDTDSEVVGRYIGSISEWVSGSICERHSGNKELVAFWNTFQYLLSDLSEGILISLRKLESSMR